jgi:hypothetical protein
MGLSLRFFRKLFFFHFFISLFTIVFYISYHKVLYIIKYNWNLSTSFLKVFYNYLICRSLGDKNIFWNLFRRQHFVSFVRINHSKYLRY